MTIQLTVQAFDKFDPDPAFQEGLKGNKCKRRPRFMGREPNLKRARLQTGNLLRDNEEYVGM